MIWPLALCLGSVAPLGMLLFIKWFFLVVGNSTSLLKQKLSLKCLSLIVVSHNTQQKYIQRSRVRRFGIATLLASHDALYQTDPAGTHSRWKAQVIGGRNAKSLREFLEQNYSADLTEEAAVRLVVQALLEVVDGGATTMEICVVREGGKEMLTTAAIEEIVKSLDTDTNPPTSE